MSPTRHMEWGGGDVKIGKSLSFFPFFFLRTTNISIPSISLLNNAELACFGNGRSLQSCSWPANDIGPFIYILEKLAHSRKYEAIFALDHCRVAKKSLKMRRRQKLGLYEEIAIFTERLPQPSVARYRTNAGYGIFARNTWPIDLVYVHMYLCGNIA